MTATAAVPDSVDAILRAAGVTALRAESSAEAQEAVLRALGGHASSLDSVRGALLRERAIHALKSIGVESPARLVDSALGAGREKANTGGSELENLLCGRGESNSHNRKIART